MKPWIKIVIALLAGACLSGLYYFRDFVFINANGQMEYLRIIDGNEYAHLIMNYTHSKMQQFFSGWSIQEILNFKKWATLGFTIAFALVSAVGLYLIKERRIAFWALVLFAFTFLIAYGISFISYTVSRQIVGWLHSPVPFLVLLLTARLQYLQLNDK